MYFVFVTKSRQKSVSCDNGKFVRLPHHALQYGGWKWWEKIDTAPSRGKKDGFWLLLFFLWGFSLADTGDSQDSRGRKGTILYSTLPLPSAHEHSRIYLQLSMCDYHIFSIAPLVFTRLLLDEIYHLIELPFDWLMIWC